ncbi:uncharacterized protein LOC115740960 [Rhodamnia argentea]|uniref:Uncharacterized protein LOC115740960 n=1 Tax=Rhodamnia argentea TaxID=178133 RepID=A0A8B8P6V5_9MYRT|nr:uncharacterized protein LOC115740960 [Rhodamnia argentea]
MVVLRSRAIAPVIESPPKRHKGEARIEPITPARAHEPAVQESPQSSAPDPDPNPNPSQDSDGVRASAVRRRSLRLASAEESTDKMALSGARKRKSRSISDEKVRVLDLDEGDERGEMGSAKEPVRDAPHAKPRREGNVDDDEVKELNVDLGLVNFSEGDGCRGFMRLRSGKSSAKSGLEVRGALVSARGDESVKVSEGEADGKVELAGRVRVEVKLFGVDLRQIVNGSVSDKERNSIEDKGKGLSVDNDGTSLVLKSDCDGIVEARRRGKYSAAEKGKAKLVEDDNLLLSNGRDVGSNQDNVVLDDSTCKTDDRRIQAETHLKRITEKQNEASALHMRERFKEIAKTNASRFAHFNPEEMEESNSPPEVERNVEVAIAEAQQDPEDWPGPFATAMKIIRDRSSKLSAKQTRSSSAKSESPVIKWVPRKDQGCDLIKPVPPSLQELCIKVLADNFDAISSLEGVPDVLRHRLCQLLCDSRRINAHFFDLLIQGCPTELCIRDCSWLAEEEFAKSFSECDTSDLTVLQLNQCGRCLADYAISSSLAKSANSLTALSTVCITGACRLTDVGLRTLVSAAPAIRSINLNQCSLLTSTSVETLANSLGSVLKELYIDDCQSIDAMLTLPALKKFEHLEVLSVSGMQSVCDDFIREFMFAQGHHMKELVLGDCKNLTDASFKVIAETCPGLLSLDIMNLIKLSDAAIGHLANGCRGIRKLILRRNTFSDEAVAAFLETSGERLEELSLNNVKKVGHNTATSLAKRARDLQILDLSWCRNLTDEAMGLIVDSCSLLKELKVFGCSQITDAFLDSHANPDVRIIGLTLSPILEHLKIHETVGPLRYS